MPTHSRPQSSTASLRSKAEEQLRQEPKEPAESSPEEMLAALQELRVHQIELEMQNEQLRATQADLELARELYVELYDFAPVGYLTLSERGLVRAANLTSTRLLGIERARLLSRPFSGFVLRGDQDSFYLWLREVFGASTTHACELRLRGGQGPVRWARLEAVRAGQGRERCCRLTLSDITERKRVEEILHERERLRLAFENEQRLRLALDAGDLGAWDQDLHTGQVVCSERAKVMLGLGPDVAVTWDTFLARLHPDDRPGFVRVAEQSTLPGGPARFEAVFRVVTPEGAVRWMRFAVRCVFPPDQPGYAIRRTGVLADITRQKEAEELLESRAKQLEMLVRERTVKLQDALSELEHFSYTLVHDLRAPLRAIRGFGDLVLEQSSDLNPSHRQYLERSCIAAKRMDQLIVDALDYNRIVRQEFALRPVDCSALLQELFVSYPQFQEARANIRIDGPLLPVLGNSALLTQCFSNLLTNALKFVASGQVPAVRIFSQDLGPRVRIWFEDNGIGIADGCQERVFEMFQRASSDYEGTGIGLALVRKAADRMRGKVGVESQTGHGSRFWLELDKAESKDIEL